MLGGKERMGEDSGGPAKEYVAPALIVLGHVRDLTEHHPHHHHHHHPWDGPNGLHPPWGVPPRIFNGSA
jgi:hypothetical protein